MKFLKKFNENRKTEINKKYTHFAIRKVDKKIVDGWEYKDLEPEDVRYYTKMDLKDNFPDNKYSDFSIYTTKSLQKMGIDPFDSENWYKH